MSASTSRFFPASNKSRQTAVSEAKFGRAGGARPATSGVTGRGSRVCRDNRSAGQFHSISRQVKALRPHLKVPRDHIRACTRTTRFAGCRDDCSSSPSVSRVQARAAHVGVSQAWRRAVRTAGQCVMADELGLNVTRITVDPAAGGVVDWSRPSQAYRYNWDAPTARLLGETDSLVALAGGAAMWLHQPTEVTAANLREDDTLATSFLDPLATALFVVPSLACAHSCDAPPARSGRRWSSPTSPSISRSAACCRARAR